MQFDPSILRPADTLLYSHKGVFDTAIRFMTRSRITHIEGVYSVAKGAITIAASRNGIGPDLYAFDPTVVKVLRPRGPVDMGKAAVWFKQPGVQHCGYGYWDMAKFLPNIAAMLPKKLMDKGMICSTFWDEFLKAGGFDAFAKNFDPGEVTPRDFDESAAFDVIWEAA